MTETWRTVFRKGVAPHLSTAGLEALERGLADDDPRLIQGCSTSPPPMKCVQDWPVEGACAICYGAWQGDGLKNVGEVEEFFAQTCFAIDQEMGEPAACRFFLNFFDEVPRDEAFPLLLAEVRLALEQRRAARQPGRAAS